MKFKKILLVASLLSTTALADTDDLYIKLKVSRFHPEKIADMAGKPNVIPGFAVGYSLNEDARVDLSIEHFSNIKHNMVVDDMHTAHSDIHNTPVCSKIAYDLPPSYDTTEQATAVAVPTLKNVCTNAKITTGKINLFLDIYKFKKSSFFVGTGFGISQINGAVIVDKVIKPIRTSYALAYDLHFGISHKVLEDTTIEVGYIYQQLTEHMYNYKGHSISTSIRIDL